MLLLIILIIITIIGHHIFFPNCCNYKQGEMKGIEVWRKSSKSEVKWSEVKCSDARWNGAVGNLNGIKPNERVVKCIWVKFNWEEVKCRQM
jgi:hypothetical protein